ncbi:hypothetical protein PCE1_002527 [Barthelona sp. PCE]
MVYSRFNQDTNCVKARVSDVRSSFKKARETVRVLKNMTLPQAQTFLRDVLDHKRCVPMTRFATGTGRCAQAKAWKTSRGRWPTKTCNILLKLLQNAEASAINKEVDVNTLVIDHIQANQAVKGRRRTYRAHGRVSPYQSNPCHLEVVLRSKADIVPAATDLQ